MKLFWVYRFWNSWLIFVWVVCKIVFFGCAHYFVANLGSFCTHLDSCPYVYSFFCRRKLFKLKQEDLRHLPQKLSVREKLPCGSQNTALVLLKWVEDARDNLPVGGFQTHRMTLWLFRERSCCINSFNMFITSGYKALCLCRLVHKTLSGHGSTGRSIFMLPLVVYKIQMELATSCTDRCELSEMKKTPQTRKRHGTELSWVDFVLSALIVWQTSLFC